MLRALFIFLLTLITITVGSIAPLNVHNLPDPEEIFIDGAIYRIPILQSGIYKISRSWISDHTNIGNINIQSNDIQIYGLQGGPLNHDTNQDDTERLRALSISINDGDDGVLSDDDFILFYADGSDGLVFDENDKQFKLIKNPFDDQNYVFLKIGGTIEQCLLRPEGAIIPPVNPTDEYLYTDIYHEDKVNLLDANTNTQGSGQIWYGDELSNIQTSDLATQFLIPESGLTDALLISSFAGRSNTTEVVNIEFGTDEMTREFSRVNTTDIEALYATTFFIEVSSSTLTSQDPININFNKRSSEAQLWLDHVSIQGIAKAHHTISPLLLNNYINIIKNKSYDGLVIKTSQPIEVWDVTDPYAVVSKSVSQADGQSLITMDQTNLKKYLCFFADQVIIPNIAMPVDNFDIIESGDVDMIIISTDITIDAAHALKSHREDNDQLQSLIVDPQEIYDLYSSGKQDPTAIRNYIRDLYSKYSRFRFLLLIGDASFDYRYINTSLPKNNLVPTFETLNSLDPLLAFPSDDYYALLDDGENGVLRGDLDISVGRLTVNTAAEANAVVQKIISYDQKKEGINTWRTRIAFVADDEDRNLHINDADRIAKEVAIKFPLVNQEKIYFDAFRQESTPGGNRYPLATKRLNKTVEQGALIINYLGHGGRNGWAQERVLKVDDINGWTNIDKLPLIITATCSFTGFDNPAITSAGEAALLNPTGGALSLFTTVRSVFASKNFRLTRSVFQEIFVKENGRFLRIGEIMRRAKNQNPSDNSNARKFFLIGDPSIQLALPVMNIKTEQINDININDIDTTQHLSALDVVHIKASVRDPNDQLMANYNGIVDIIVYDKASDIQTFANDSRSFVTTFQSQQNIIYRGNAAVKNGIISTTFTIPVDIDYKIGPTKITYYAIAQNLPDAAGFSNDLRVGGDSQNPISDDQPPVIGVFLNDRSFVDGTEVPLANKVIVDLSDDFGINVSNAGIGHEITAILDGDSQSTIFLNEFFVGSTDDPRSGIIIFNLQKLDIGTHTLTIKAFDIANNIGETTITFIVSDAIVKNITKITNHPNPIKDLTTFVLETDLLDGEILISMNVYDMKGRLVESVQTSAISRSGQLSMKWLPVISSGGAYLCHFALKTSSTGQSELSMIKKVILLK